MNRIIVPVEIFSVIALLVAGGREFYFKSRRHIFLIA